MFNRGAWTSFFPAVLPSYYSNVSKQNSIYFRGISNSKFHENKNRMYTEESSKKLPPKLISSMFLYSAVELWNYTHGINSASEKNFNVDLVILRVTIPHYISISQSSAWWVSSVLCWQVLFSNFSVTQRWQLGIHHQEKGCSLLENFTHSLNSLLW